MSQEAVQRLPLAYAGTPVVRWWYDPDMPITRAVVTLQKDSGLPEDVIQHTFHFSVPVGPWEAADFSDIGGALDSFYCAMGAVSGQKLTGYMSPKIADEPLPKVRYYPVDTGGSQIGESDLLGWVTNEAGIALPDELALCMTYHADLDGIPEEVPGGPAGPAGDTRPRARRRGRVYLGSFATAAQLNSVNTDGRPDANLIQTVKDAALRLVNWPGFATRGITWVVYSPTDGVARDVVGGWVDDAWDIQRRRGLERTARNIWSA